MSLMWKVIWTVVVVICGVGGAYLIGEFFQAIQDLFTDFSVGALFTVILAWVAVLPLWFVWKGTKLIPIIFNIITRSLLIVALVALPVIGGIIGGSAEAWCSTVAAIGTIGFAMVGIWLKS